MIIRKISFISLVFAVIVIASTIMLLSFELQSTEDAVFEVVEYGTMNDFNDKGLTRFGEDVAGENNKKSKIMMAVTQNCYIPNTFTISKNRELFTGRVVNETGQGIELFAGNTYLISFESELNSKEFTATAFKLKGDVKSRDSNLKKCIGDNQPIKAVFSSAIRENSVLGPDLNKACGKRILWHAETGIDIPWVGREIPDSFLGVYVSKEDLRNYCEDEGDGAYDVETKTGGPRKNPINCFRDLYAPKDNDVNTYQCFDSYDAKEEEDSSRKWGYGRYVGCPIGTEFHPNDGNCWKEGSTYGTGKGGTSCSGDEECISTGLTDHYCSRSDGAAGRQICLPKEEANDWCPLSADDNSDIACISGDCSSGRCE